jgi:hypothetical protein
MIVLTDKKRKIFLKENMICVMINKNFSGGKI